MENVVVICVSNGVLSFYSNFLYKFFSLLLCGVISIAEAKQYFAIQRQKKKSREKHRVYFFVVNITLLSVYETVRIIAVYEKQPLHGVRACTWVSMVVIDGKMVCDLCRLHCFQAWNFHKTDDDDDNDYNNDGLKSKTAFWSIHI